MSASSIPVLAYSLASSYRKLDFEWMSWDYQRWNEANNDARFETSPDYNLDTLIYHWHYTQSLHNETHRGEIGFIYAELVICIKICWVAQLAHSCPSKVTRPQTTRNDNAAENFVCDKNEFARQEFRLININDHGSAQKLIIHSSFCDYQSSRISQRTSFSALPQKAIPRSTQTRRKCKNHFHIYRLMPLEDWVNLYSSFCTESGVLLLRPMCHFTILHVWLKF